MNLEMNFLACVYEQLNQIIKCLKSLYPWNQELIGIANSAQQKSCDLGVRFWGFIIASQLCYKIFVKLDDYLRKYSTKFDGTCTVMLFRMSYPPDNSWNFKIVPCSPEILCWRDVTFHSKIVLRSSPECQQVRDAWIYIICWSLETWKGCDQHEP